VLVCHVLRYTPFFGRVKELLMNDAIGEPVSVLHVEAVGNVHQSHSYVRGNWHSEAETTPMLLAKSCHDLDILQWLLDKPCKKVQSFGSLTHFTKENAPEGAPVRCADGGCPKADTCPYNCMKLYYEDKNNNWFRGTSTKNIAKGEIATDEEVLQALRTNTPTRFTCNERRCMTYAQHLADQFATICALPSGLYHVASEGGLTTYECAQLVAARLGASEKTIGQLILPDTQRYADRFRDFRLDASKAIGAGISLGTFEEDVCRCLADFGW
jgi:hypothetical protein